MGGFYTVKIGGVKLWYFKGSSILGFIKWCGVGGIFKGIGPPGFI